MLGFRAQSFVPNIYDCLNAVESSVGDVNRTARFLMYNKNYMWFDYTFNVTQLISGVIADSSRDCAFSTF